MNPIKALRKQNHLSRQQLGFLLGIGYSAITQVELGHTATIPESWQEGLERLGIDYWELQEDYLEWREAQREAVMERLAR